MSHRSCVHSTVLRRAGMLALAVALVPMLALDATAATAARWAGDASSANINMTRTPRHGGPGALTPLTSTSMLLESSEPGLLSAGGDDGYWTLLAGSGAGSPGYAPRRVTAAAIYDPVRHRTVMFGGSSNDYFDQTFVLDSATLDWVELATSGPPPSPRRLHTAVYDGENDRMVVFGGYDGTFLGDVWALSFQTDPPTWSHLTPAGPAPDARAGHTAIYDPVGRRMIVFGGYDGVSSPALRRADVWSLSLDGTPEWTDITPAASGPSARSSHAAVYDGARGRMVIIGGTDPAFRNDVWALSLDATPAWSEIAPAGSLPAPREEHSAIYDVTNDQIVIFGGYDPYFYYGDTWALSLAEPPTWTELDPAGTGPVPRWGHIAAYDPAQSRMIVFGGAVGGWSSNGTFVLDLIGTPTWINPVQYPGPGPVRHTFATAYDTKRNRLVLFGGSTVSSYVNDTWVITLDDHPQWSLLTTQGTPPSPRRLVEGIYDPVGDRMIVFGGFDGIILGGLYQLSFATDPPTWSVLGATGPTPHARAGHGMVYDPIGRRAIVFGGYDGVSYPYYRRNDVWALELRNSPQWQELTPTGVPPIPRSSPSVVYDNHRNRMIVFGGTGPEFLNDTWALSLGAGGGHWSFVSASGPLPVVREEASAVYDPVRDRMIIVGGYVDEYFTAVDDIWELNLENTPAEWRQMSPTGPQPPVRWGHAAVYDPLRDRMVMHGGLGPGLDQTWSLTWGHPAAVVPALASSEATTEMVRTTWDVGGGTYLTANLYRSEDGTTWESAGVAPIGADGEVMFEDHGVTPGTTYAYKAGVTAGDSERLSLPEWVNVPELLDVGAADARLAVLAFRTGAGLVTASISLPSNAPARLVLYDISGRVVSSVALRGLGVGGHDVSLATPAALSPGVYVLRLTQDGAEARLKAVVLR